jgi:hypothetical protein
MLSRPISPANSSRLTGLKQTAKKAMSISLSGLLPRPKMPLSALFPRPAPSPEAVVQHPGFAPHEFPVPSKSHRRNIIPDDVSIRSEKSAPLAPITRFSPEPHFRNRGRFQEPIDSARGTNDVAFGRDLAADSEQPPLDQAQASRHDALSSGQSRTTEDAQLQGSRPAVSTLHIDGSALGRWAVQHLERALGKPATGMTGVDPRATIPRSRVAPF